MQQIKFLKVTELLFCAREIFETLKKQKINLAINSSDEAFNAEINMMLRSNFYGQLVSATAELVLISIENHHFLRKLA
jgi:Golgi nucleoside diphosphatase